MVGWLFRCYDRARYCDANPPYKGEIEGTVNNAMLGRTCPPQSAIDGLGRAESASVADFAILAWLSFVGRNPLLLRTPPIM